MNRRRSATAPANPRPTSANVPGSGATVSAEELSVHCNGVENRASLVTLQNSGDDVAVGRDNAGSRGFTGPEAEGEIGIPTASVRFAVHGISARYGERRDSGKVGRVCPNSPDAGLSVIVVACPTPAAAAVRQVVASKCLDSLFSRAALYIVPPGLVSLHNL